MARLYHYCNSFCARPHESMQPHDLLAKSSLGDTEVGVPAAPKFLDDLISARLNVERQSAIPCLLCNGRIPASDQC